MDIPLPKIVPDTLPGGNIVTSMLGGNALTKSNLDIAAQRLKNQYYAPNIQSQIDYRNSQTQGQDITNKYLPNSLQSEIGLRNAQAGNFAADTRKTNYMVDNPWLLGSGDAQLIQLAQQMQHANQNNQSSSPAQNNTGNSIANIPLNNSNNNPMNSSVPDVPVSSSQNALQQPANAANPANVNSGNAFDPLHPFNTGNPTIDSLLNAKVASAQYQNKMAKGFNYVHSPADAKDYMIAQLAGAGVDPSEAVSLLTNGSTVPEILQQKGFDPKNPPDPDFLPTKGNITKLKQRQAALKELNTISDFVTSGLAPYSQTFNGYSPQQIVDALKDQDEDKQANFYAARALSPEQNNLRLITAQARTGKAAMQAMADKSMNNISIFRSQVKPSVWTKTQNLVDKVLSSGLGNAEKAYTVGKSNSKNTSNENKVIKFTRDSSGRLVRSP